MKGNWLLKIAVVMVATFATSATAFAQSELKDNEEVNGRIAQPGQNDTWLFELKEPTKTINIDVSCKTAKLVIFLHRVGDNVPILLRATRGQNGGPNTNVGGGVMGLDISASPNPDKVPALDKGKYIVVVRAVDGKGTGDYTIKIPELKPERKKPESKAEQLERLKKDLDGIRAREAELMEQIKKLEAEMKK